MRYDLHKFTRFGEIG